jgi:hypothetical protein
MAASSRVVCLSRETGSVQDKKKKIGPSFVLTAGGKKTLYVPLQ